MTTRRKPKGKPEFDGINASSLNVALRRCLSAEAIRGETHVEMVCFSIPQRKALIFPFMMRIITWLGCITIIKEL